MKKLFYLGWWFLRARLFGRKAPLQTVLFISDICNLRCKHCSVYELKNPHNMTYEQVREHLQYSYDLGSRFVDFEGGEVTIWKDGDKRIENELSRMIDITPNRNMNRSQWVIANVMNMLLYGKGQGVTVTLKDIDGNDAYDVGTADELFAFAALHIRIPSTISYLSSWRESNPPPSLPTERRTPYL